MNHQNQSQPKPLLYHYIFLLQNSVTQLFFTGPNPDSFFLPIQLRRFHSMFKQFNIILCRHIIERRNLQDFSSLWEKFCLRLFYITQPEEICTISIKMKAR